MSGSAGICGIANGDPTCGGGGSTPTSDDACCFVWDVGGIESGNTFVVWANLVAALALVEGEKTIRVDAAATIPAGVYDLNDAWLIGPLVDPGGVRVKVTAAETTILLGWRGISGLITVTSLNTGAELVRLDDNQTFIIRNQASMESSDPTGQALIGNPGDNATIQLENGGRLAASEDDPVVVAAIGNTLNIVLVGGIIGADSLSGPGIIKVIGVDGDFERSQPLHTGTLTPVYTDPTQNGFAIVVAPSQVPFASLDATGNEYVVALDDVFLPKATESEGPHTILAFRADVVVGLIEALDTLDGQINGTTTIPDGGFATFTSNGGSNWAMTSMGIQGAPQYYAASIALASGVAIFVVPCGVTSGGLATPGGFGSRWVRVTAGRFHQFEFRSSVAHAPADISVHAILNGGAPVFLGDFPASGAGVSVSLEVPLGTFTWAAGDEVQLSITSFAGLALADTFLTVVEGFAQ